MLFYDEFKNTPFADIPDIAFMYMEINNWQGMSLRCGVWQYYESRAFENGKSERVLSCLRDNNEEEMSSIYTCGIHDYANEKYRENYDYPEEWLDEADKIDEWIRDNEVHIYKWMRDLILTIVLFKDADIRMGVERKTMIPLMNYTLLNRWMVLF